MAKITKKIRIAKYDSVNNQFDLTFQLASYDQVFTVEWSPELIDLSAQSEQHLRELGFEYDTTEQMIDEVCSWAHRSRKSLGGLSHVHTMQSRFDLTERLEQERRGEAEAERIVVEAPCLDYAMSVTEELVDEAIIGADESNPVKWHLVDCSPVIAPTKPDAKPEKLSGAAWYQPKKAWKAPENSDFSNTVRAVPPEPLDIAAQQAVEATSDRVAAMETVGMGEKANLIELNIVEGSPGLGETPSSSELLASLYEGIKSRAEVYAEFGFTPPKLPTEAIEKAVNAIHKHTRLFLTPMSLREHDSLRAVIQAEIERVVGGVL